MESTVAMKTLMGVNQDSKVVKTTTWGVSDISVVYTSFTLWGCAVVPESLRKTRSKVNRTFSFVLLPRIILILILSTFFKPIELANFLFTYFFFLNFNPVIEHTWDRFTNKTEPLGALWQVPRTINHPGSNTNICSQLLGVWGFVGPVGIVHRRTIHPGHRIS